MAEFYAGVSWTDPGGGGGGTTPEGPSSRITLWNAYGF